MDGPVVKLERMVTPLSEFIEKVQTYNTVSLPEKKKELVKDILFAVEDLRNSLTNCLESTDIEKQEEFNDQIDKLFTEYNWTVNFLIKPNEFTKFFLYCKYLVTSLMRILGRRNCGILVVQMHLKMCIKVVNELSVNVETQNNVLKDMMLYQLLIKGYITTTRMFKKLWYIVVSPNHKYSVMLCLNQAFKTLCFLGKVIDKGVVYLVKFLLNRLEQCFTKAAEGFFIPEVQMVKIEFIILMDLCLNKLNQLSYNILENLNDNSKELLQTLKSLTEELLIHAMSVCHILNNGDDCNLIKICSQKILDDFGQITSLITTNNKNDIEVNIEKLHDSYYKLEQAVNIAVLNAVLDLFTDVNAPLRALMNKLNTDTDLRIRTANDLEPEICNFDDHMDRIINIGLFAVSCSTDVKRILEIRSCLASLESLEPELITAIVSLYLNPNHVNLSTFQFLVRNWLEEMRELRKVIDLILDPAAFCEIVEKRVSTLMFKLQNDESPTISKIRTIHNQIVSCTKKLIKTLKKNVENEEEQNKNKIKEMIENLHLAFQEFRASMTLLDLTTTPKEIADRTIKRTILVITAINNLTRHFIDLVNISDESVENNATTTAHKNYSKRTDAGNSTALPSESSSVYVLTPYINKGKLRIKQRTVLYDTLKYTQHLQNTNESLVQTEAKSWQEGLRSHSRNRCCKLLTHNVELENSLNMELTELVDTVKDLTSTLDNLYIDFESESDNFRDSVKNGIQEKASNEEFEMGKRKRLNSNFSEESIASTSAIDEEDNTYTGTNTPELLSQLLHELSVSSLMPLDMDIKFKNETLERINDLNIVQKRISLLMKDAID